MIGSKSWHEPPRPCSTCAWAGAHVTWLADAIHTAEISRRGISPSARRTSEARIPLFPRHAARIPLDDPVAADRDHFCRSAVCDYPAGSIGREKTLGFHIALRRLDGAAGAADLYAAGSVVSEAGHRHLSDLRRAADWRRNGALRPAHDLAKTWREGMDESHGLHLSRSRRPVRPWPPGCAGASGTALGENSRGC